MAACRTPWGPQSNLIDFGEISGPHFESCSAIVGYNSCFFDFLSGHSLHRFFDSKCGRTHIMIWCERYHKQKLFAEIGVFIVHGVVFGCFFDALAGITLFDSCCHVGLKIHGFSEGEPIRSTSRSAVKSHQIWWALHNYTDCRPATSS